MKFVEKDFLEFFSYKEFDSPDLPGSGKNMDKEFLSMLTKARILANVPFVINSGYRTKVHNDELRYEGLMASPNSSHMKGMAADIYTPDSYHRYQILNGLILAGFNRIGIGDNFIHADSDKSKNNQVVWTY